jgi:hypothetical protein
VGQNVLLTFLTQPRFTLASYIQFRNSNISQVLFKKRRASWWLPTEVVFTVPVQRFNWLIPTRKYKGPCFVQAALFGMNWYDHHRPYQPERQNDFRAALGWWHCIRITRIYWSTQLNYSDIFRWSICSSWSNLQETDWRLECWVSKSAESVISLIPSTHISPYAMGS